MDTPKVVKCDPFRTKVELTPEQKEKRLQSLAVARERQRNLQEKSANPIS